jgi:hypothetical protein
MSIALLILPDNGGKLPVNRLFGSGRLDTGF